MKKLMENLNTSSGIALWNKAKKLIPGGNQLLSKRSEMFLPELWPSYYKKAKGCEVWDLDGNHFYDMSLMGVGSCILGYANEDVNSAVQKAITDGNMTTLNCSEEVELAEKLIQLHPWADMVRFAKTGGEACAIAVRIARAATKKNKVAFCGYHGWHDWYLAANIADKKHLDAQLLPGLSTQGVPHELMDTSLPFHYGKIEELEKIIHEYKDEIGSIIMEVAREKIDLDFLKQVKDIAQKNNIVLIYDEISSGFRQCAGGMHLLYGLEPDMVILGKAMGNGYPISAIVGKRALMQSAQDSFISSTFWTERIGFVAALEVIRQFETKEITRQLMEMGQYFKEKMAALLLEKGLNIEVRGLDPSPSLYIGENDSAAVKTLFTQEMLKRGFLASTLFYVSIVHTQSVIDKYSAAADEVLDQIKSAVKNNDVRNELQGPVCQTGFTRLT